MSKKTVPFAPLPNRAQQPEGGADDHPQDAPLDFSRQGQDNWVLAAHPVLGEPVAMAPDVGSGHLMIDLSAKRTWFELAQLIWIFPFLATWYWMPQAMAVLPRPSKPS